MPKHHTRVGLHARNTKFFPGQDYALVNEIRIETLKMMSDTDVSVYERLRQENPELQFIVRLYDHRLRHDTRPEPPDFVAKMADRIQQLQPYTKKFEIHNEPNHASGLEGWGSSAQDARDFLKWYMQVLAALRQRFPWARFGFPGLAVPAFVHNDLEWLDICKPAIKASHWLGCHTYWQYDNMMKEQWGLRFKLYHKRFPNKRIEITEFGNSTEANDATREQVAQQYVQYYRELNKYSYLGSASAFIASSPDPEWAKFVWMKDGGERLPVVPAIRDMERVAVEIPSPLPPDLGQPVPPGPSQPVPPAPSQPTPPSQPPAERTFPQTGKTVRGTFLRFFEKYGLDICGYPISEQIEEFGLPAQYFQRLGLEEVEPDKIRLKLVGTEFLSSREKIAQMEARIEELSQHPATGGGAKPPIEDITDQLVTHATNRYESRTLADIDQIVIHHTATSPTITPQRLAEYQVRKMDKPGITYHFVVTRDGTLYQTNQLETVADHAYSRNKSSIGICFPGNFMKVVPPEAQIQAGGQLCAWLLGLLRLPNSKIVGLTEFVNHQSPGKQWLKGKRWKDTLLAEVDAALAADGQDQAALIASLREQIQALKQQIAELEEQLSIPTPVPSPEPVAAKVEKPNIQYLVDKLPKHPSKTYPTRQLSDIQALVVHHSAAPPHVGPKPIARYHINHWDWAGIGYHFLVAADGIIYQGNRLETVSKHAGNVNSTTVGICFLGSFMKKAPPPEQIRAGAHLIAWLIQELDIDLEMVRGHKEYMTTSCPGNQWLKDQKWKGLLRQEIAKVQEEVEPLSSTPGAKPIYHYVLFWTQDGTWAQQDWFNAQNYIGRFHPTVGFRVTDAAQAEFVTIVGGPLGVPQSAEDWLAGQGCKIDRIAGEDEEHTQQMLDELADQGKRFLSFDE